MNKKLSIELVNCNMSINKGSSYMYLSNRESNTLDIEKMIVNAIGEYKGNVNIVISVEEVPSKTVVNSQWDEEIETSENLLVNESLLELNEEYKTTISELTSQLNTANGEVLRLENEMSDLKCELSNEVDYLKHGKPSDGEELY